MVKTDCPEIRDLLDPLDLLEPTDLQVHPVQMEHLEHVQHKLFHNPPRHLALRIARKSYSRNLLRHLALSSAHKLYSRNLPRHQFAVVQPPAKVALSSVRIHALSLLVTSLPSLHRWCSPYNP